MCDGQRTLSRSGADNCISGLVEGLWRMTPERPKPLFHVSKEDERRRSGDVWVLPFKPTTQDTVCDIQAKDGFPSALILGWSTEYGVFRTKIYWPKTSAITARCTSRGLMEY